MNGLWLPRSKDGANNTKGIDMKTKGQLKGKAMKALSSFALHNHMP